MDENRIITIEDVKRNARIDNPLEDDVIDMYAKTAEQITLANLSRTYTDLLEEYGMIPVPIKQACAMLATCWYDNRQPLSNVNMSVVPYTYEFLIKPYMKL